MAKKRKEDRAVKRRLRSSYITSLISITLVLLTIGLMALLVLYANKLSTFAKENISLKVVISDEVKEADILRLKKSIDASRYVKTTDYVTKEEAAKEHMEYLGEDFVSFLGFNPLLPMIQVRVNANYANNDSLAIIQKELASVNGVKEVKYDKDMVQMLNDNIRKISLGILVLSALLILIAIVLINNTIRLSIYAKRFIIRTMQLVGASRGFIRRPYIWKGVIQGIISAFLAIAAIIGILDLFVQGMPELKEIKDIDLFIISFGFVIAMGIIISWITTFFAVRKYLKMKVDKLYYF